MSGKLRLGIFEARKSPDEEKILRSELFNIKQLKQHAKCLAKKHLAYCKKGKDRLLRRLEENEEVLNRIQNILKETDKSKRRITPAGEWLLDNYFLIQEQIRLAQKYLPKDYIQGLPHISEGLFLGYPCVYEIAMEIVSHSDGCLDRERLTEYVASYQTVRHLKLGELWAFPIMLRLALIENLRRISSRLIVAYAERDKANYWATHILKIPVKDTDAMILEIGKMSKANQQFSDTFVAEFMRRLHGQTHAFSILFLWLEKKLLEQGENLDKIIRSISQKQAADQVSIANTIGSLRFLGTTDWCDFVESLSIVEKILNQDPSEHYSRMSFSTRDRYRHSVERFSLRSKLPESEIAKRVVQLANKAKTEKGAGHATAHVGFYLIDRGLEVFCRHLGLRLTFGQQLEAKKTFWPSILFFGSVILMTLVVSAAVLNRIQPRMALDLPWFFLFAISLLFVTSQTIVSLVNWISMMFVKPQNLPRMDFSEGIPADAHTLVVVPCILSNLEVINSLLEDLYVRYLANIDA
ncbi:MAG: cyclic beta 1-2 glucan synthetase, partial [Candidatus Omnitrophica bacterium]|nr:cyclic beta 1-2 glucan synthetase [Candidatus Omnitrophota bacterium]